MPLAFTQEDFLVCFRLRSVWTHLNRIWCAFCKVIIALFNNVAGRRGWAGGGGGVPILAGGEGVEGYHRVILTEIYWVFSKLFTWIQVITWIIQIAFSQIRTIRGPNSTIFRTIQGQTQPFPEQCTHPISDYNALIQFQISWKWCV